LEMGLTASPGDRLRRIAMQSGADPERPVMLW
jgi:hypothetical protein